ncbi:MAG TPA: hypothetical protein PKY82_02700 [Pyrinomonadaceae bacterium]|nr:hypothetical protein [Pyrinomonadaceae bacterium]
MQKFSWKVGFPILFAIVMVLGCSNIQKLTSQVTIKNITPSAMCEAENINKTVSVTGYIGKPPDFGLTVKNANGEMQMPYGLTEKSVAEPQGFANQFVFLVKGEGNNQIDEQNTFVKSTVKTSSGEVIPITNMVKVTGKVIRTGEKCNLLEATVSQP